MSHNVRDLAPAAAFGVELLISSLALTRRAAPAMMQPVHLG